MVSVIAVHDLLQPCTDVGNRLVHSKAQRSLKGLQLRHHALLRRFPPDGECSVAPSLPEIGGELGGDAIVEGSVLREGNKVRITAQLIEARTDQHLWARTYVRDLTSVLALQSEVAKEIADEIRVNVTPQVQARLARSRSVNEKTQDLYLQGASLLP